MNQEYALGLYEHNARSYEKVKEAFEKEDIVGIVHATGTGKSYNALQLAYDNRDKEIIYVVPSNSIIEHLLQVIESSGLSLGRDFPNLKFRTYQSFNDYSMDEIREIPCDLLILDEFHHMGADVWGSQLVKLIATHEQMKVFGMTAYTVRGRGTENELDMAEEGGLALFSDKIVSRYDLCDAMLEGVLPKPVYKSAYVHLTETAEALEKRVESLNPNTPEYAQYKEILDRVKRKIQEAPSISELLKKSIKPNGKYIYFCPPISSEGENDIETIKKQALEWFKQIGYKEEDIEFYTSTSEMGVEGKKNREAFYNDQTLSGEPANGKLRIMFAINQYNEGVHAPNIDGVILGRATSSDIVFFEQLGRALAVRGDSKAEYERLDKYSRDELVNMCLEKDILVKVGTPKEAIIGMLLAPTIIDLTNNIGFIRQLEHNLQERMTDTVNIKGGDSRKRNIKISDASFDITIENIDLFEELKYIMDGLTNTWDKKYELAKAYYEYYGNLEVPNKFKTINGYEYDENGVTLGSWIFTQRNAYKEVGAWKINSDQVKKLNAIGMVWSVYEDTWNKHYDLAKVYYKYYGNLDIPQKYRTLDGIHEIKEGEKGYDRAVRLGQWISRQRKVYNGDLEDKIESEQVKKLNAIGMIWNTFKNSWEENYELAKAYYKYYGNLDIPQKYRTLDGIHEIKEGEKGYDRAVRLGQWIGEQRKHYKGTENDERVRKLNAIGMIWNVAENFWQLNYELAKAYYEYHGNLNIPKKYRTLDGIHEVKEGEEGYDRAVQLGKWISRQRTAYNGDLEGRIKPEKVKRLNAIGMIWDIKKNQSEVESFCDEKGINVDKNKITLKGISLAVLQIKTAFLEDMNMLVVDENGRLHPIFKMSSPNMKEEYGVTMEELYANYYVEPEKEVQI